jgi:hypothetical protein
MHLRGGALVRRALILSVLTLATVMVVVSPANARRDDNSGSTSGEHCVAQVVDQRSDGELITGEPTCFGTFAEAMSAASAGEVELALDTPGSAVFTDEFVGTLAASFTLGIHFDGANGTGASIGITGTSCTGGYWNALGWWANRISSSFNGCYHLRHYDKPSRVGSYYNTYGGGQIDNIASWFNNRTESVAYYAW